MEGFNIIDGVILGIVLISAILAYARGIVREAMAIVGWIVAAGVAFAFAPQMVPLVKEIPIIGPILADSCELSVIGGFAVVFAITLVVVSFFTPLLSSVIDKTSASRVDQALGFLFGLLRGVALIAIMFFAYSSVLSTEPFELVEQSKSSELFSNVVANIEARNPERLLGWITTQYENLVAVCG